MADGLTGFGWNSGIAGELTKAEVYRAGSAHGLPTPEMLVGVAGIGESINEDKIAIHVEEPAGRAFKDHSSEEAGVLASLPAAKEIASSCADLNNRLNVDLI